MKKFLFLIVIFLLPVCKSESAERAELVTQPAYHSMKFYVYKPANLSGEYYATFDGYLVYKDSKGVWNYATVEKGGIAKTGYVVGAVIPSVVRLKPYNKNISSVAPILGTDRTENNTYNPRNINLPGMYSYSDSNSEIVTSSNFMAVSKWHSSVDRIGVLDRPMIPVAWKGESPEIIYAWTGSQWRQINSRGKNIKALSTIRREIYDLTLYTNKSNSAKWNNNDTQVLSQFALIWGYKWLGTINTGRNY